MISSLILRCLLHLKQLPDSKAGLPHPLGELPPDQPTARPLRMGFDPDVATHQVGQRRLLQDDLLSRVKSDGGAQVPVPRRQES